MISFRPPEILAHLGELELRTYGVVMAVALLVGFFWAEGRARVRGIKPKLMSDVLFWSSVGGVIGARLGFILQNLDFFTAHPNELMSLQLNGLSFHGALVGGLIGLWVTLRMHRATKDFWSVADVLAAPLLLGPIIGRLGNWANQELYGYPTNLPWGIVIDPAHRLPGFETFTAFHPTFAYEGMLNLIGLIIVLKLIEKRQQGAGTSFLFALGWYAFARFITEFWRIGDPVVGPLSLAQIISIIMVIVVFGLAKKIVR